MGDQVYGNQACLRSREEVFSKAVCRIGLLFSVDKVVKRKSRWCAWIAFHLWAHQSSIRTDDVTSGEQAGAGVITKQTAQVFGSSLFVEIL